MSHRIVETDVDRASLIELIKRHEVPFTVTIEKGRSRTLEQNRLQHMWHKEAAEQLEDESAEEKRAYCKLHFGIPIVRNDESFRAVYDQVLRPLPYEHKLKIMMAPIDFPVTRYMTVAQKIEFLDKIYVFYTSLGVILTQPKEGL